MFYHSINKYLMPTGLAVGTQQFKTKQNLSWSFRSSPEEQVSGRTHFGLDTEMMCFLIEACSSVQAT